MYVTCLDDAQCVDSIANCIALIEPLFQNTTYARQGVVEVPKLLYKTVMDRSTVLESGEEELRVSDAGNAETVEYFKSGRTESQGEETESEVTYSISERSNYLQIPYGFQSRGSYKHASKNCEIVGGMRRG